MKGYRSVRDIDLDSELYSYYKLERLGLVLDMHFNHDQRNASTEAYLKSFNEAKERVLRF
jgi:hypothetical protein